MHIVFSHDHRFLCDQNGIAYSDGTFPYAVWERYLEVFDRMTVIGRHGTTDTPGQLSVSSGPGIEFEYVASLSHPWDTITKRRQVEDAIELQLKQAAGLIARVPSQISIAAIRVAKRLRKPWMVEVVGCPWDVALNYGGAYIAPLAPVWRHSMRKAVEHAPFAVYVTQQFLQRRYPTEGWSVACSNVEIPEPDSLTLHRRIERIHRIKCDFVLGIIASLTPRYKGIETAFDALRRIGDDTLSLRILGPGSPEPWRHMAQRMGIGHRVHFDGSRPAGAAVYDWLDNIDLYLQPSYTEGMPRAMIEAMFRACPSLGSSVGGIPELLPEECLHKPKDSATLARQIQEIRSNPGQMERLATWNHVRSRDYCRPRLQRIRRSVYEQFAAYCRSNP